jgi:hypothetical protein
MSILQDRPWKLKYTPDHGDLVKLLYQPLLECAVRYDRLTGYFSASALGRPCATACRRDTACCQCPRDAAKRLNATPLNFTDNVKSDSTD